MIEQRLEKEATMGVVELASNCQSAWSEQGLIDIVVDSSWGILRTFRFFGIIQFWFKFSLVILIEEEGFRILIGVAVEAEVVVVGAVVGTVAVAVVAAVIRGTVVAVVVGRFRGVGFTVVVALVVTRATWASVGIVDVLVTVNPLVVTMTW